MASSSRLRSFRSASQRDEGTQPAVAQIEPAPEQHAEIDTEQDVREQWATDTQMAGDRAAQIAGHQDRPQNGGLRNHIEDRADERKDPESAGQAYRISQLSRRLNDDIQRYQFHAAVEQQEHDNQSADDAPRPERLVGNRSRRN